MRVAGCGCSLIDYLYSGIDFSSAAFSSLLSRSDGDGGLAPGKLVFAEDLEGFSGKSLPGILSELVGGRAPDAVNLGGPAVVALINLAQLAGSDAEVSFHGYRSDDAPGQTAARILSRTPVLADGYRIRPGNSPATWVLSDPSYDGGNGERSFINAIGSAGEFTPGDLGPNFFKSDIVLFGGTALTPGIHDRLSTVLKRSRDAGALTVVNTVYDFRNQQRAPGKPWPMGDGDAAYSLTDLLLTDREEALRLAGSSTIGQAGEFFLKNGVRTAVITNGAEPFQIYSDGTLFETAGRGRNFPVSKRIGAEIASGVTAGDTTGCGDNFVGGFLYSMVRQLRSGNTGPLSLADAAAWAAASGGYACHYMGGTFLENRSGEKLALIRSYVQEYLTGIGKTDKNS